RLLVHAVDLRRDVVALLLEGALRAVLLAAGGRERRPAAGGEGVAPGLLLVPELAVDARGLLAREVLDRRGLGLRLLLHALLFLVRVGELARVDHVELLLGDAFLLQLRVGLVGVAADVGVLLLERRDRALAEVHRRRVRRRLGGRQPDRDVVRRHGRRRRAHVAEGRDHRVLVALHDLEHVGAHVPAAAVLLEIVDVLQRLRDVLLERLGQPPLGLLRLDDGGGAAADRLDLAGVAGRLLLALRDHDRVLRLRELLVRVVVRLLVLREARQRRAAAREHGQRL